MGGDNSADAQSNAIDSLRSRFINLKNENKKLKQRKFAIDEECDSIR